MATLLIDAGNTRLKWGLLGADGIHRTGHIAMAGIRDAGLAGLTSKLPADVDRAFASNVAGPSFATRLAGVLGARYACDLRLAKCVRQGWGVTCAYAQPRRMGVDRWVAMVGAWAEIGDACLVVDAGTAMTLDAIDADGRHLGGQIVAGIDLMTGALAAETCDIPAVSRARGGFEGLDLFASSTARAVQAGALAAAAGAVRHALDILAANGHAPTVVLTGGDAPRLLPQLGDDVLHRPHLVLQGLARMLDD